MQAWFNITALPPRIRLSGGPYIQITKGEPLVLNATEAINPNIETKKENSNYKLPNIYWYTKRYESDMFPGLPRKLDDILLSNKNCALPLTEACEGILAVYSRVSSAYYAKGFKE